MFFVCLIVYIFSDNFDTVIVQWLISDISDATPIPSQFLQSIIQIFALDFEILDGIINNNESFELADDDGTFFPVSNWICV